MAGKTTKTFISEKQSQKGHFIASFLYRIIKAGRSFKMLQNSTDLIEVEGNHSELMFFV